MNGRRARYIRAAAVEITAGDTKWLRSTARAMRRAWTRRRDFGRVQARLDMAREYDRMRARRGVR